MGAGFEEIESSGKQIRRPLRIMIENCIDDDGSILDVPRDDFRVQHNPLHTSVAALYVAGQQLVQQQPPAPAHATGCRGRTKFIPAPRSARTATPALRSGEVGEPASSPGRPALPVV